MNPEKKRRFQKILSKAYGSKPVPETSSRFEADVMRRIRNLEMEKGLTDVWIIFQPIVWRFATAAACLAFFLSVNVFQTGFLPQYEIAEIILEEMTDDIEDFPF